MSVCAAWLAAKTYLWSREIKTLEDAPGKADGGGLLFGGVIYQGEAPVAGAVDRSDLLFGHILDGLRVRPRVSRDAEGADFVIEAVADVVIGIDDLERALGQRAGVLDRNQYAVEDPAGGQSPAREVIALATSGQKYEYKAG